MTEAELKEARQRIKRRLYSYIDLKKERDQIRQELAHVVADVASPKTPSLDGMPRSGGFGDAMTGKVSSILKVRKLYERKQDELAAAMLEIEEIINGLEPTERLLMRYRYLDGMTWEKVSVAINYSWRQTHKIH
ncbi:MAG: hypothetical protein IKY91_00555, partial [Akkermansia sp.]|nr:hypothetical protein [Akkermansia sp.]